MNSNSSTAIGCSWHPQLLQAKFVQIFSEVSWGRGGAWLEVPPTYPLRTTVVTEQIDPRTERTEMNLDLNFRPAQDGYVMPGKLLNFSAPQCPQEGNGTHGGARISQNHQC